MVTSYDSAKILAVAVALAMGCYLSRSHWCRPALGAAAPDDDDDGGGGGAAEAEDRGVGRLRSPRERHDAGGGPRRVRFRDPLCAVRPIALLRDVPLWIREETYWRAQDYAQIRDNQRRLIELVLRQARDAPDGGVPPPIPGESRRGLGICCEPGTNSGRAARVRSARRAIVEAQRDGYSPAQLAELAAELSRWAGRNARDVGLKDAAAIVADFDYASFGRAEAAPPPPAPAAPAPPPPPSPKRQASGLVARAARSAAGTASGTGAPDADEPAEADADGADGVDGLGLASMIRSDSLSDLSAAAAPPPAAPGAKAEPPPALEGAGLASMIRSDSLGDLAAHAPPHAPPQ